VGRSTKTNTKRSVVSSLSDDEPLAQRLEQSTPVLWDYGLRPCSIQAGRNVADQTNELFHRPLTTDVVRLALNIPEAF